MSCSPHGLSFVHWLWSIGMGSIGLIISVVIKLTTKNLMIDVHVKPGS